MRSLIFKTILSLALAVTCMTANDVNAQHLGIIRGTVKLKDKPLGSVMVTVRSPEVGQRSSISNSKGEYEIRNLQNGTYLLTVGNTPYVMSDGIGGGMFKQLEVKSSGVTIFDIPLTEGALVTGCVQYASKQPVIERQVIYENTDLDLNGFSLMSFRQTAVTNDQGCFRLYGLPSGKYRVGVGKPVNGLSTDLSVPFLPVYYPGVQQQSEAGLVEIIAGRERDLGTLVLQNKTRTGSINGIFVNSANGDRVPGLSFELVKYDERGINSITSLKTDDAGEFQIENQSIGRYRIQPAVRSGRNVSFTFQSLSFELNETSPSEITILCTSLAAAIQGDVRINNHDVAGNKDCSIALKEGEGIGVSEGNIYRVTLNGGRFELSGLPRGVYTLVIMPLRTSLQFEQAQVGAQTLRSALGPIGMVKIDLTAGNQVVKISLTESADKTP